MDNNLLTARAPIEDKTAAKIHVTFYKIEAWAFKNGMVFHKRKFEAIYFSSKRYFSNPETVLLPNKTVGMDKRIIEPMEKKESMC